MPNAITLDTALPHNYNSIVQIKLLRYHYCGLR